MNRLRVGLVGAGAMGANHARVIGTSQDAQLAVVVDKDLERANRLAAPADAVAATELEAIASCDAVVVACPTEHHEEVALELVERDLPVLVEKPLAATVAGSRSIADAAERRGVPLMCGFVERFNAAVVTAADLLDSPPVHLMSIRHSPPTPRITTSVVYDLLIHDIDLALRIAGDVPVESVTAAGSDGPSSGVTEVADCTLRFANNAVATLSASRLSQRKIRSLLVTTPTALVDVDLLRQDVTVYRNTRQEQLDGSPTYRAETVIDIPFVRHTGEPLALQLAHFVQLIRGEADDAAERASLLEPHVVAAKVESTATSEPLLVGATK